MLLFGLLLIVATGAFTGLLIADNLSGGPEYQVTILGQDLVTLDALGIFLAGLALALLFCLGLALATARVFRRRRGARHAARSGKHPAEDVRQDRPPVREEAADREDSGVRADPAVRDVRGEPPARGDAPRSPSVDGAGGRAAAAPGEEASPGGGLRRLPGR
ncbi:hypothetical protein [Streptomyces sp. BE303]|uniref:hypothetical protein n=1 Tax=Streptomyces sp. BE303 TaxID=3002528 RepID=UPI002E7628C9|nr:hypothetical protein [Streptomyces sp. BE303]MED7947695.1 hypothetical protein [Streptomyces sp. BE303]